MMRRILPPGLAVAILVPWCLAGEMKPAKPAQPPNRPTAQPPDPAEVQDAVLFGEARPVLLRLHVRVDGKPFQAVWEDFLRDAFRHFDRDQDGVLSREEAALVPPPQQFLGGAYLFGVGSSFPRSSEAGPQPDKLTFRDFAATLQEYRGAFGAQVSLVANPRASALTDSLFARLDADRDGKISKEELTRATTSLYRLDLDGDEVVTPEEVVANIAQMGVQGRPSSRSRGGPCPMTPRSP